MSPSRRYYPRARSVLLGPFMVGCLFGVPVLKNALGVAYAFAVFLAGFAATLALWRWFLRVEVGEGTLRGRSPDQVRHTVLELSEITSVRVGEFVIGRIKGWVFEATESRAVFVPEPALADPELRRIFDSHGQQCETTV